jgi:NAD+ kinase
MDVVVSSLSVSAEHYRYHSFRLINCLAEGDHIKVTASKYPFPTVCADKSSTDWFQAISRTLKWNERERQKSFVVVEENPAANTKKSSKQTTNAPVSSNEELQEDDEEDEVDDEDEGFDIDVVEDDSTSDMSQSAITIAQETLLRPQEKQIGREKAQEDAQAHAGDQARAEAAARALARGTPDVLRTTGLRSGIHSGIDSPDRFISAHPDPPHSHTHPQPNPTRSPISARHVAFAMNTRDPSSSLSSNTSTPHAESLIHSPHALRHGEQPHYLDRENVKTPTSSDPRKAGRKNRSRSREPSKQQAPQGTTSRAFAVWGQDESESESDVNASEDEVH